MTKDPPVGSEGETRARVYADKGAGRTTDFCPQSCDSTILPRG